ncbi:hypothetical protein, partial [Staphylococcus epidermidis]|uniref:hypothetical protein n=1 Tax=Staphylococcus epidermidis TaxID=1282 RepID=UPI001C930A5C
QQTTHLLTHPPIKPKPHHLLDLKHNLIIPNLIPPPTPITPYTHIQYNKPTPPVTQTTQELETIE